MRYEIEFDDKMVGDYFFTITNYFNGIFDHFKRKDLLRNGMCVADFENKVRTLELFGAKTDVGYYEDNGFYRIAWARINEHEFVKNKKFNPNELVNALREIAHPEEQEVTTKMNELKIFKNSEFGSIRTTEIDGTPYFVGKDVAEILGYSNPRKAIIDHVDVEDKGVTKCDTLGGTQDLTVINESGLYSLILSSKLPTAKRFKHWVTSEVLPSIRKNGGYIKDQENLSDAEVLAKAVLLAQNVIAEKDKVIEAMRPKEIFADAVATSKSSILIGDLAKLLKQNGYETGQKRLFEQLRQEGYLIKSGSSKNMPTQKSMQKKLFKVKETTIANADGSMRVTRTTVVTGVGQMYFINKFLGRALEETA